MHRVFGNLAVAYDPKRGYLLEKVVEYDPEGQYDRPLEKPTATSAEISKRIEDYLDRLADTGGHWRRHERALLN